MVHSQNPPQAVPYTRWALKNNDNDPINFNHNNFGFGIRPRIIPSGILAGKTTDNSPREFKTAKKISNIQPTDTYQRAFPWTVPPWFAICNYLLCPL
jgi:hypothetical protein